MLRGWQEFINQGETMEMLEQVSNYEQEIKFITGFAGSGKSTKLVEKANPKTLILTPTHKAAAVLIRKGVENVYTIHSVLKLVPTINENYIPGKHRMQRLKQIGGTDLSKIHTVFIDEFSMINVEIMDLLLSVLPESTKITVFGDPYQLPPVDGEAIDPLFYTDNIEELTVQHRAEAPEVVDTFMRFMRYIKDGKGDDLRFHPAIKHGDLKDFNPDTDRALAFTNARVLEINNEIAGILNLPTEFSNGEALIANQIDCILINSKEALNGKIYPQCISKGKLMSGDKLGIAVTKIENDIEKYNTQIPYPLSTIEIDGIKHSIYYDKNHYATQKKLKAEVDKWQSYVYQVNNIPEDIQLKNWCRDNKTAKGVKERGRAWSEYMAHGSLVFNLQRPFATTIHKSQGSEFSTVYVAQGDIKKSIRNGYYMQYARLMYVALSRAINKVVII